jgi:hypothetical protein
MYAKKKVDERLAIASREFHVEPEYHSVQEVDQFDAYLRERGKYLYDNMGRPSATTGLTDFDRAWMLNEQILCASDASYWLTRYCNPPEAPIWMGDLSFKSLGDVKVGDEVMGWVRVPRINIGTWKNKGFTREIWKRSKVLAIGRRIAPIVKVTMASGTVIRCTPDHLWSSGNHGRSRTPWIVAKPGWILRRAVRVYSNEASDLWKAAWLGGIYDGEGSGVSIAQHKGHNPEVYARIVEYMKDLGFQPGAHASGEIISINGGISERSRFVTQCRPARRRSMERYIFKTLNTEQDVVVSVEPDGEGEVVSMQTETGNYTAWGYASKNCFLVDEEGAIMRFQFRMAQRILFDIIAELEERDAAIEIITLKARQLGITSLIQPLIGHRVFFGYGVNAIAGSADQQKTGIMASKMLLAYDHMPVWLRPQYTRRVESERGMLVFGGTLSGVSFQHGSQMSGIARGTTPTIYHLSEVASFVNASALIDSSLFKCVHASPSVFGVLESTGEGDKGWWPDTWRRSKSTWPLSRLCPLFLPWFCGIGLYPTATWLGMRPVPDGWVPNADTRKHIAKAQLYVASTPLLSKHLGEVWRLPREQQWWWEITHEEAKSKGGEGEFLQELAGDDEEALQRSAESVFGHDAIALIDSGRERKYTVWGISGQSIEDAHEPPTELIDYSRERIPIVYASMKGDRYRWELIPLAFSPPPREDDPADISGTLLIWHPPRPGVNYSIGVDTSEGKGQDSTVISVWALGYNKQPDIQVAEFSSPYVSHVEAFSFVLCIAAYYKIHMEQGITKWREPYVSVEQVAAVGDTCQLQMSKMGYTNFHLMSRYDDKRPNKKRARKRGWYTYGYTRPLLTGNFVHSTRNGWAVVNSPWLIEEMKTFEVHVTSTGREKLEHEEGEHDDRIFAAAMAIFCPHDMDMLADRSKKRIAEASALPPIDMTPYQGPMVSSASLRETAVRSIDDLVFSSTALERYRDA